MIRAPGFALPRLAPSVAPPPSPSSGVVHEAESQRQHVRVRLPGTIDFEVHGTRQRARLFDLSAGGFSFVQPNHGLKPGLVMTGSLVINHEPIGFTLPVKFQVRNEDARSGRVGCRFQDLGAREIGSLRQLISAMLTGDAVTVGDVLRRPSPAGARPRAAATPPMERQTFGSRVRALVVSAVALTFGVSAFGYALKQVHHILFVTSATAGKVAGPVYTVAMPREGMFNSLVPEDNLVKKGAAIASFEAPVLDLVRGQALASNISAEQLAKLTSQVVKGTITSPCDCRVQTQFVANAQYAGRGQPLFELVPREVKDPYVMARFRFDQVDKIATGTRVQFHVTGEMQPRTGKIAQLRVPNETDTVGGDIIAMIEPDRPLPPELVNRPATVDVGGFARFDPLAIMTSMAAAPENPK